MSNAKTHRASICLFSLAALLVLTGCPHMPVADPGTESRIYNQTDEAIEVELILDPQKYGLKPSDDTAPLAQAWLEEYKAGDGVEVISLDAANNTGRYRIASGGFMIVHSALGTKPYLQFKTLKLTRGGKTQTFNGEENIVKLFQATDAPYRYEFLVK